MSMTTATAATVAENSLYDDVVDILHEHFEIPVADITPDAQLAEDLDIDSIDAVDLIVQMQQRLGQRLHPEAFNSVRTVDDVVKALDELVTTK